MTWKQRIAIGAGAVGIIAAAVTAIAIWSFSRQQPSVVLIIIDTLRQDRLSAYGYPEPTSPEIDRMAERGVRFERVIAQSSWTRPSIGSMLTSQHPRTLGIYNEKDQILPDDFVTLAEMLDEAGYTTIGATANPNINSAFNFQRGFDEYVDSSVLFHWMDRPEEAPTYAEQRMPSAKQIFGTLLREAKKRGSPPYYLQANVMEAHEFRDDRLNLSKYEPLFSDGPDRRYLATIRLISEEIDRFAEALSAIPGFDRTLFVIVSDHGEGLRDHRPVELSNKHGRLLYQSQVLVPLVLYATDDSLPEGTVVSARFRLLDLVPTLLDYLGLEQPPNLVGKSFMDTIEGSEPSPQMPSRFVVETEFRSAEAIGVYAPNWEYIEHRRPHPGTDPRELQKKGGFERGSLTNQIELHPETADSLRAFLKRWERSHPKARPTRPLKPLPILEARQLRALGYIE